MRPVTGDAQDAKKELPSPKILLNNFHSRKRPSSIEEQNARFNLAKRRMRGILYKWHMLPFLFFLPKKNNLGKRKNNLNHLLNIRKIVSVANKL